MSQISISELSQAISELIDLDTDQQSLMTAAIDRALDARQIVGGAVMAKGRPPMVTGQIATTDPFDQSFTPVIVNGLIYDPSYFPIGRIANPNPTPVLDPPALPSLPVRHRPRHRFRY